ncbi:MAG: cytoplasmic protein [Verrucomicrobiota bacterium]
MQQFENFRASSLYCNKCQKAMPVREKLLLILPDKEIFDYLCTGCASSLGQREVTAGDRLAARTATSPRRKPRSLSVSPFLPI